MWEGAGPGSGRGGMYVRPDGDRYPPRLPLSRAVTLCTVADGDRPDTRGRWSGVRPHPAARIKHTDTAVPSDGGGGAQPPPNADITYTTYTHTANRGRGNRLHQTDKPGRNDETNPMLRKKNSGQTCQAISRSIKTARTANLVRSGHKRYTPLSKLH